MKHIRLCLTATIALLLCLSFNTATHAQKFPVLIADSVDKWSEPTVVRIMNEYNQIAELEVFVKVKKFKGTTGFCVVFFRNTGNKTITSWAGLQIGAKADTESIYTVNAGHFTLKPGEEVSYNLELRECWPKGTKGFNAAAKCAACAPNICFAEVKIKE
jgi:hypothetical protein